MAVQKITFTTSNVTAQNDADLYYFLMSEVGALKGIKDELSCTSVSNRITFKSGYLNIYGRQIFVEENTSITIPLDSAKYGYVIVDVNTSINEVNLTYKEDTNQYPSLIQNDLSKDLGQYQFPIAAYTKTSTNLILDTEFHLKYIQKKQSAMIGKSETGKLLTVGEDGFITVISKEDLPISTAAQNALNGKVDKTTTINGKSLSNSVTINKGDIGLGNVDNTADKDKSVKYAVSAGGVNLAHVTGVKIIYHHFVSIQVYNGSGQPAGTININLLYDSNKIDTLGDLIKAINYCIDYNLDSQELSCTGCVYLNDAQHDGFMYVPFGMYTTSQDDIFVRAYRVGLTLVTEEFDLVDGSIVQDYAKPLLTLS